MRVLINIFEREAGSAMREYMNMKDENGKPMDKNAARAAAILVGTINAGLEFLQISTIVKQFPGGEKLLGTLDKKAIGKLLQNPTIRKKLADLVKDRVMDIGTETFQEIAQEAVTIIGGEVGKAISKQPFAKFDFENAFSRLFEISKQTFQTMTVFALAGAAAHGIKNTPSLIKGQFDQINYKKNLREGAEQLGISVEELEQKIQEAVQQTQEELNNTKQSEENTAPAINEEQAQTTTEENITPAADEAQTDLTPEINETQTQENITPEQEQEKTDFIFIPREQFEKAKSENENLSNIDGVAVDREIALTREQFEQVKENAPEFTAEIANDIREGADGVTISETSEKIENTDPRQADFYHSPENQKVIKKVTENFIKAGESQEEAELLGQVVGAINSSMMTREGEAFTQIIVKNASETQNETTPTDSRLNPKYDINNPLTWPDQERSNEVLELSAWDGLSDIEKNTKDLFDILRGKKPEKAENLSGKSKEVIKGLKEEAPPRIKSTLKNLLRQELNDYKISLSEAATDFTESLAAKENLDTARYELNSEMPKGKKRKGDFTYTFNNYDGETVIDFALDKADLKVKIKTPNDKSNPFIFAIKNYQNANLNQVLNDILGGNSKKGLALNEAPVGKYLTQALNDFWTQEGLKVEAINQFRTLSEEQSSQNILPVEIEKSNGKTYNYLDAEGNPVAFTSWKYGRAFINLIKAGNFAANVHEIGHVTLNLMDSLRKSGSIQMQNDFQIILDHAGVTLEAWEADTKNSKGGAREKAHEYFSKAFEIYMAEGKAPTTKLQKVFDRVKKFLLKIYDDIHTQLGIEIDDDVRGVFDRLFTMQGDDNATIAEIITANNQLENQIKAYEAQIRALETEKFTPTDEEISESLNDEISQEDLENAERVLDALDYEEFLEEEYQTQRDYIQNFIKTVKEQIGSIDFVGLAHAYGIETARELRKTWGTLIKGRVLKNQKTDMLTLSKQAQVLANAGLNDIVGPEGDANLLAEFLSDNAPMAKKRADSIDYSSTLRSIGKNIKTSKEFFYALREQIGDELAVEYLKERFNYLEEQKNQETSNFTTEDINTEQNLINELLEFEEKLTPEKTIKKKKSKKTAITKKDIREAAETGYKLGQQEERATQELKGQVKMAKWKQRAEERLNKLREAREADKAKLKEKSQERLQREQEKHQQRIEKIQERIKNLRNNYSFRQQQRNIKTIIKSLTRMQKSKSIIFSKLQEIREFLDGYDFDRSRKKQERRDLINFILSDEGEQYQDRQKILEENNITQEEIEEMTSKIHLADLPYSEVVNLYQKVKGMYEQGRRKFELWQNERDKRRINLNSQMEEHTSQYKDAEQQIVYKDGKDTKKDLGRVGEIGVMFWTEVQTPGRFLESLGKNFRRIFEDGFTKLRGNAEKFIYQRQLKILAKMKELGITPARFFDDAITIDGETFSYENVMAIYAGMKNEKNAKAILWGNFVQNLADTRKKYATPEEGMTAINKILEFINQPENQKYKTLADLIIQDFDENFDRINEAQIKNFNRGMNKEDNYVPMFRLKHQSSQGLIDAETESIGSAQSSMEILNKVADNFTMSRENISEQMQQPISLTLWSNWNKAMRQQEYSASLGGYASDIVSALLIKGKNGSIQEQIKKKLGLPYWNTLRSIFNDSLADRVILEQDSIDKIMSYLARARSVAYVSWSLTSALAQTASYITALPYTNNFHLFRSLGDFISMGVQGRGREFLERVYQKSPELRVTGGDVVSRSIQDNTQYSNSTAKNAVLRKGINSYRRFINYGYEGVRTLDNWTKSIIFDAVYQSRLADGYSDADAVRLANRAVHDTQPASTMREMPRIFRKGGATNLFFTQFMNALSPIFNMSFVDIARNIASPSWNSVKATAWNMLAVTLTFYYSQLIKDFINGKLPTREELPSGEEDNWSKWLSETFIDNLISVVPVFNQLSDLLRRGMGKKQFRSENRFVEPFTAFYNAYDYAFNEKYNGEYKGRAVEEFIKGLSLIGVPIPFSGIRQLGRIFGVFE